MKNANRFAILLGASLAIAFQAAASPTLAQAVGDATASGGTTGDYSQSDDLNTGKQAMKIFDPNVNNYIGKTSPIETPLTRGGLPYAQMNTMAPASVDMNPLPSGQFHYGFPNLGAAPFLGVDSSKSSPFSMGGMLPQTSTSSVDFNTVDCPFIRGPYGGGSPGGLGNINVTIPVNIPGLGNIPIGGSINTNQALQGLQNFFGP
jgi:hypothetical protein